MIFGDWESIEMELGIGLKLLIIVNPIFQRGDTKIPFKLLGQLPWSLAGDQFKEINTSLLMLTIHNLPNG